MDDSSEIEKFSKIAKVTVLNKTGEKIDEFYLRCGTNLWVFIRKRGLPIGSACSGVGVCGACDLNIVEMSINAIAPSNEFEQATLIRNSKPKTSRLSCLCRVFGDITIQSSYW